MSKLAIFVSATIVLIFSYGPLVQAAPQEIMPEETSLHPVEGSESRPIDENMSMVEAKPVQTKPDIQPPPYYPYRQQLTLRIGKASRVGKIDFDDDILGFQYLFPKFLSPKLEAGADLHKNGKGHIHVGLRWIFFERDYFRPSYKISLDHKVDSDERLASFAEIDNYYARLTGTLEYVIWNPTSIRLEAEQLSNFRYSEWILSIGLSRGW